MIRSLGPYFPNRPRKLNEPLLTMLLNGLHDRHSGRVFVVQVGAGTGQGAPALLPRFRNDGWSGLLIEPHPAHFAALESLHADSDRVAVLNLGISDLSGTYPLYALSSDAQERHPRIAPHRASVQRDRVLGPGMTEADLDAVEVPFLRMDTVLGELGIDTTQLVVVNAGGHEAQALSSFALGALSPDLVLIRTLPGTPAEADCLPRLSDAALLPFRLADWLVGLRPGALSVPLEELLTFLQRGVGQSQEAPE